MNLSRSISLIWIIVYAIAILFTYAVFVYAKLKQRHAPLYIYLHVWLICAANLLLNLKMLSLYHQISHANNNYYEIITSSKFCRDSLSLLTQAVLVSIMIMLYKRQIARQ